MNTAAASVISVSAEPPPILKRIRKTSAFLRKLSLNAEKNWHQNSGAKRRDSNRGLVPVCVEAMGPSLCQRIVTAPVSRRPRRGYILGLATVAGGFWAHPEAAAQGGTTMRLKASLCVLALIAPMSMADAAEIKVL